MPVHPQISAILGMFPRVDMLDWRTVDAGTVRSILDAPLPPPFDIKLARIDDISIRVDGGSIPARLYRLRPGDGLPTIVYFHGGGWVVGSIDSYDFLCRQFAAATGCAVLSVGYRLAPEYPYPVPLEDCYAAVQWVAKWGAAYGLDGRHLAVMGDSAGGNLAGAVAVLTRERGGAPLRRQVLLYPVTDSDFDNRSYQEHDDQFLTASMMRWFWKHYVGAAAIPQLAAICRLDDVTGLAPATVVTAEFDVLRDEGEAYALKLAQAGVPTELVRAPGMIHGFISLAAAVDPAQAWLDHVAERLRTALVSTESQS
jgi:acetyl esterase